MILTFTLLISRFLDGNVTCATSYGVNISQLIWFARVSSHLADSNACNKTSTAKLLQQRYRHHKLRKAFSDQFSKIVICYKWKGYNTDVIKQSACLVVDPIMVDHFAYPFNCMLVGRGSDSMMAQLKNYSFRLLGRNFLCLFLSHQGSTGGFLLLQYLEDFIKCHTSNSVYS